MHIVYEIGTDRVNIFYNIYFYPTLNLAPKSILRKLIPLALFSELSLPASVYCHQAS
jgi:hypothetical protein